MRRVVQAARAVGPIGVGPMAQLDRAPLLVGPSADLVWSSAGLLGQVRLLGPFDHLVFNSSSPMPAHLHCPLRHQHVHQFSAESRSSFGFLDLEQLALNEIIEA